MKFTAKTDCTLLELILAHHPGMSNSKAKKMIENYKVKCGESVLKRPVDAVLKGQVVEFLQREAIKTVKVDDFRLRIVYEDKWMIVAHKPFGIVSSGDTLKEGQTLYTQIRAYLRSKYGMREQLFVVHRLDKAVEGLIMFARSEAVKEKLQENWKQVNKYYVAQTTAIPAEKSGTIHSWLREEEHMKDLIRTYLECQRVGVHCVRTCDCHIMCWHRLRQAGPSIESVSLFCRSFNGGKWCAIFNIAF